MKKVLLITSALFIYFNSDSQCSLKEVPLAQRLNNSNLIVEGKVIEKHSFWNTAHNMIYTANTIELFKIFKGSVSTTSVEIITEGGIVADRMIKVDPSLLLNAGDIGIFTCENLNKMKLGDHLSALPQFGVYASVQGFVKYNLQEGTASDVFAKYTDIEKLYNAIQPNYQVIKSFNFLLKAHICKKAC